MSSFIKSWLAALWLLFGLSAAAAERPNIVFVMADDLGYGDVKALNPGSRLPTPNLDRLAGEGMTFTDAHSPSAVCTPTRYGVVTGRYCWRSRLKRGVLNGYGKHLIDPERTTVASFLKEAGYATGSVGKWHLGFDFGESAGELDLTRPVECTPTAYGFESSYMIPASLDFPPYVYIWNNRVTQPEYVEQPAIPFPRFLRKGERSTAFVMEDVSDHLTEKACGFITEKAAGDKPFLLYFPLPSPHKPVWPHPRFVGRTELGPYGDYVFQVDWIVGQVMKALDDAGVAKNTLLFFTSDNGSFMYRYGEDQPDHLDDQTKQGYRASRHTSNGALRGTKADIWEAGHRVPFFARWPGVIKAGSKCEQTITHTDFFATCAEVAGKPLPKDAAEDSFSWLPLLKGGDWETPRAPVIHHSASGMFAIREGHWKLVLGDGSGGRERPRGKPFKKPYQLFDLSKDPSEKQNQIEAHPKVAERLEKKCLEIRDAGRSRD